MSALFLWTWTWARNKAIWYWRRLTSTITTPLHLLLSARYTYEALQNDDDSAIRLLYLYPGPGPLRMALKNVHLDYSDGAEATRKAPPYEAISYAWGDSTLTESVYCNDKRLDIPASLYAALRQLRPAEPGDSGSDTSAAPRVLWADAACINQRDVDEKNHQVGLMDKIYARPTSVLIWIGADTEGLQDVGASIARMRSLLPAETYDAQELVQISKDYYEKTANLKKQNKLDEHWHHNDWTAINNLLCRSWFDRKWIIQEVLMAPRDVPRTIISGNLELPWEDLASLGYSMAAYGLSVSASGFSCLYGYPASIGTFYAESGRPLRSLFNSQMIKVIQHYRHEATLLDCFIATGMFASTETCDQVYALLSLTPSHRQRSDFRADYGRSIKEVCLAFARSTLVHDQNLKGLGIAPHRNVVIPGTPGQPPPPTRIPGLPSWVPDLTMPVLDEPLASYSIRGPLFCAGGESSLDYKIDVSEDGSTLHLRGRVVATIEDFAPSFMTVPLASEADILPKKGFMPRMRMRYRDWFWSCQTLAFPVPSDPSAPHTTPPLPPTTEGENKDKGGDGYSIPLTPSQALQQSHYRSQPTPIRRAFALTLLCGSVGMHDPVPLDVLDTLIEYIDFMTDVLTSPAGYVWKDEQPELRDRLVRSGGLIETSLNGLGTTRKFCVARLVVDRHGGSDGGVRGGGEEEGSDLQEEDQKEGQVPGETRTFGMAKMAAQKGDLICAISGAEVPYILRPVIAGSIAANDEDVSPGKVSNSKTKAQRYELIGDCYLSGFMQGEALRDSRFVEVDIDLV